MEFELEFCVCVCLASATNLNVFDNLDLFLIFIKYYRFVSISFYFDWVLITKEMREIKTTLNFEV